MADERSAGFLKMIEELNARHLIGVDENSAGRQVFENIGEEMPLAAIWQMMDSQR